MSLPDGVVLNAERHKGQLLPQHCREGPCELVVLKLKPLFQWGKRKVIVSKCQDVWYERTLEAHRLTVKPVARWSGTEPDNAL